MKHTIEYFRENCFDCNNTQGSVTLIMFLLFFFFEKLKKIV